MAPGEWVGYNKGFQARGARRTATLPVGHADGIGRIYGQGAGQVLIGGKTAPIIGNVCMDMTMVDAGDISEITVGDEVVVFGRQGAARLGADELANMLDTIPRPLLDRMEVIQLAGYTNLEKLQIAKRYLLPRQRSEAGSRRGQGPVLMTGEVSRSGVAQGTSPSMFPAANRRHPPSLLGGGPTTQA